MKPIKDLTCIALAGVITFNIGVETTSVNNNKTRLKSLKPERALLKSEHSAKARII